MVKLVLKENHIIIYDSDPKLLEKIRDDILEFKIIERVMRA